MIDLKLISNNRKKCMGIAIIFIMFCHTTLSFISNRNLSSIVSILQMIAQMGVDIFFILSGMGLCFSLSRDKNIKNFYKRRFTRIIPTYLFVAVFYSLFMIVLRLSSLQQQVNSFSLISFFTSGNLNEWFIAAILILYIIFPAIYLLVKKNENALLVLLILVILFSFLFSQMDSLPQNIRTVNGIFIVRIPSFLMGCLIGNKINNGNNMIKIKKSQNNLLFIIMLILCLLIAYKRPHNDWWYLRFLYMFLSLSFLIVICNYIGKKKSSMFYLCFEFLGNLTLEIYLLHEKIQNFVYLLSSRFNLMSSGVLDHILVTIIVIATTIICSYILSHIISSFCKIIEHCSKRLHI